jgi:hypothetical protein
MPRHTLNLYDKPAIGNQFIKRYTAFNYRHKIAAMGWFDTASCDLVVSRAEAEKWIDQHLGNRVAFYVDNPVEPIWEGLVSRIMYQVGGITFTVSLDNLYNRTRVTYSAPATSTVPQQTAAANNTDSQAVYGIKEGSIDAPVIDVASGVATHKTILRDMILSFAAWPQMSTVQGGSGTAIVLSLEFIGFYHTLEWEMYQSTAGGTSQPNTLISANMLPNLDNGTTFFDNTDTGLIVSNAAYSMTPNERTGKTFWQKIQEATEPGDGTSRWIAGITPTGYGGTTTRRFYYRQANYDVEYTVRLSEALRIRTLYGNIVKPWNVRPDRGIRLLDVLTGWSGLGDDPREAYLEVIEYDAESQQVSWQSSDDISTEGAFQLRRLMKPHGTRFGAQVRQTWS